MTIQTLLTIWSIRLALLFFSLAMIARFCGMGRGKSDVTGGRVVRVIWVTGCLLAVVHLLAVFGYLMHWSHGAAVEHTAEKTRQLIGMPFGGGVYFNYGFFIVWVCDAAWWCGWPDSYRRRRWLWDLLLIGYLWFIFFNATAVFESGVIRWFGLSATVIMAIVGCRALIARKRLP